MKPRIAQVTKYFHPHKGGIESHVLGISEEFIKRGSEVKVFTANVSEGKKREELNKIKVYRAHAFFTFSNDPFAPGALINLLKEDYDLIHVHLPDPFSGVFAYTASLIKSRPLIITYHADILKNRWHEKILAAIYRPIQHLILRHSRKIIATTPNYAQESQVLGKFRDKIEFAPNFVDDERFSPLIDGSSVKKKHKLRDKKIILFLGRLVPYKGVRYLIESFTELKDEMRDIVLIIAGDGILRDELIKLAGEGEDVIFTKPTEDEIPRYYAACDLFILPSVTRQEAFGITLLEAMSSGKPCITTNISGMPYVVGDCGITVSPENAAALKYALMELLSNDADIRERGACGRKRVKEHFTKEKVAERIFNIYKNIL